MIANPVTRDRPEWPNGFTLGASFRSFLYFFAETVTASGWVFAAFNAAGDVVEALADEPGNDRHPSQSALRREQRALMQKRGDVVVARAKSFGKHYADGISVLFRDLGDATGLLMFLRDQQLPRFAKADLEMIRRLLSSSDAVKAARSADASASTAHASLAQRAWPVFALLDGDGRIVAHSLRDGADDDLRLELAVGATLPAHLHAVVLEATADWTEDARERRAVLPLPTLAVRVFPVVAREGPLTGCVLEAYRPRLTIFSAMRRYSLSEREVEVIHELLDGATVKEIAKRLSITASTVQDHINSLVVKTATRNRSHMLAHVLGWRGR